MFAVLIGAEINPTCLTVNVYRRLYLAPMSLRFVASNRCVLNIDRGLGDVKVLSFMVGHNLKKLNRKGVTRLSRALRQ